MKSIVITADGELTHINGRLDWDETIGPEGRDRVRLHPSVAVSGWVNDVGLLYPERFPRNVVGSLLLVNLGASVMPYAGPVVFTGWNAGNTALGLTEIEPLFPARADAIDNIHAEVRRALAGDPPREMSPSWAEQMREVADHVRTAPTPGLTVIRGERP
ncbi:hypothetical protein ACIOWI_29470 [Streptomyces sp. NPDC087659]|uniref:hypothetical protein n=1 Tax=Streptomyces sp. NPDC087659 TaxID=3365801 RepID=UPI0038093FF5